MANDERIEQGSTYFNNALAFAEFLRKRRSTLLANAGSSCRID